ncbi:MAG: DUF4874 domain-containing protein, partial [Kiritimatiellae bacterium]|nr:DUF4874 domain-containing protein [Kiritimatiellia bacterium]
MPFPRHRLQPIAPLALAALIAQTAASLELVATVTPADGAETFANPGCGFAPGGWGDSLVPGGPTNGVNLCANTMNCSKMWSLHKFSKGYIYGDNYTTQTNHYAHITNFVGGADIPLDENALLSISNSLLSCRRNGGTCIPRFAYTWDAWGGAEPDDFDMILTHIRQISAVLSQFRDIVPAIECGIIGAYGEMHTSRYTAPDYQNQIVAAWLNGLPPDMALLVRSPPVWMRYLGTTTPAFFSAGMDALDAPLRARMGFYNDGYLGTDWDYGTWGNGGGTYTWSRGEARRFLRDQAVPYGGENAGVTPDYFDANVHLLDTNRFNIVAEWYDTHLSYLRTIRATSMTVVQRLAQTKFSPLAWAFDGMPDLSEYDGADLRKFCEDHMGFRFVVRDVAAHGRAGGATLSLSIENTGFGQLLFDESLDLLLVPSSPIPDSPFLIPNASLAIPDSPLATIRGGETASLDISFDYPDDLPSGRYDIYLRASAPLADEPSPSPLPRRPIRFANAGCHDASLKANYLCTLELDDIADIPLANVWFAHRAATGATYGGSWTATNEAAAGDWPTSAFAIDNPA